MILAAAGASSAWLIHQQKPTSCASRGQEVDLGSVADFVEGETYEVKVFNGKIYVYVLSKLLVPITGKSSVLLAYVDGEFHCTGASCTHYSAPLVKGCIQLAPAA